ncbi:hypothetical protein INR49_018077 [Caranx melampygus]|nr:hypothetical protein INR49_018077 [Caranx melampygus]
MQDGGERLCCSRAMGCFVKRRIEMRSTETFDSRCEQELSAERRHVRGLGLNNGPYNKPWLIMAEQKLSEQTRSLSWVTPM